MIFDLDKKYSLKDKRILDLGGSNIPEGFMRELGLKQFVSLDPVSKWAGSGAIKSVAGGNRYMDKYVFSLNELNSSVLGNNFCFIIDCGAEELENTIILDDYFDFIISMSAFEHVTNISVCMKVIYKLLHNEGVFYTHFQPIYSSAKGHHIYLNEDICFAKLPQLNHKHLLNTKEEIKEFIDVNFDWSDDHKKIVLFQMTDHSEIINKKMFKNYWFKNLVV